MDVQLQVAGAVETCQAVLFDMDGVLVDLSPGRTNAELVAQVAPHLDAAAEERLLLEQEVATAGDVRACAGALELIAQLPARSWAVVTSGNRPVALARLRAAGFGEPAVLVSADDITAGKPDPQGYEMAAHLLGVTAQACVVVEDAVAGLQAAAAAGMRAVAVEGETGPLPAPYTHSVRSLTQVSAGLD